MVTVGMYYEVIGGKEKAFEDKFDQILPVLEDQPGHVQSLLYQRVRHPSSYAIISEWETREGFTAFIRSDVFRSVTDWGKAEILKARPRHHIYGAAEESA